MGAALDVHRLHFAFTITFHYLFPQLTMGLALLIVILKTAFLRTGDEHYNHAARFWAKIFGINFAVGVVGAYGLKIGIIWWAIGIILATGYFVYVYKTFAGKVTANSDGHGYGD